MEICRSVPELHRALAGLPRPVGLVPTLGALHEGHASLVRRCRAECATVVASVFVNKLQFNEAADFEKYPRTLDADAGLLASEGGQLLFAPPSAGFYPPGFQTRVTMGPLAEGFEGRHRPGHFDGVCTVVAKLFGCVRPERAYFGEKDAQQVAVIRRLSADLDLGVEIVACPTIRAPDGLALSSRNRRLSPADRARARGIAQGLFRARAAWQAGERSFEKLEQTGRESGLTYDYLACVDPATFARPGPLMIAAARVGEVRLIDNLRLDES